MEITNFGPLIMTNDATGSSKTAVMIAPSGFAINVVYHIRK